MIADWKHWWVCPLLMFCGITGPGGYRYLLSDPELVTIMPAPLYYVLLAAVLLAVGILAGAAVLGALWSVDQLIEEVAVRRAAVDADIAALRALPVRDEVAA